MDQVQPQLPGTNERSADRKAKGRKAADGTEKTLKPLTVKAGLAECMKLLRKVESAKENYQDAVKKLAESGGFQASALNKLLKVSLNGKFAEAKRDIDQVQILFDEVGEAAGGKGADD